MFKKFLVFALLLAFFLMSAPPVRSQGAPQFITMGLDYETYANPYDPIMIFWGWGACQAPGLVQTYQNAATFVIEINGVTTFDGSATQDYWHEIELFQEDNPDCHNHSSDVYLAWWTLDLGTLPVGDYTIVNRRILDHQVTDLFDVEHYQNGVFYEVDGKPDKYGPGTDTFTILLHVVE